MKLISLLICLSLSAFSNVEILDRVETEVGKDLGVKLTILSDISEERSPEVIHKLCLIESQSGDITYVINFDTALNELSLVDELGSHHISNKQIWSIQDFSAANIPMVSFYGVDAVKGSMSSALSKDGTTLSIEYLYSIGSYRTKKLTLAHIDGKWALYRSSLLKLKPIKSIFFKAKKNFLGMVTGISEIILR